MRNPKFLRLTNWQSRTALAISPPLFTFGFTAERQLTNRMEEMAEENEQRNRSNHQQMIRFKAPKKASEQSEEEELLRVHDMYRNALLKQNNVQIVTNGNSLSPFQKSANYVQEHPFKCISAIGVPSVAYIYYREGLKKAGDAVISESFSPMRLLHTRVFGQFAVLCTLLGVMGVKAIMDHHGKYVTEDEIENRVQEMEDIMNQHHLMTRTEYMDSLKQ